MRQSGCSCLPFAKKSFNFLDFLLVFLYDNNGTAGWYIIPDHCSPLPVYFHNWCLDLLVCVVPLSWGLLLISNKWFCDVLSCFLLRNIWYGVGIGYFIQEKFSSMITAQAVFSFRKLSLRKKTALNWQWYKCSPKTTQNLHDCV